MEKNKKPMVLQITAKINKINDLLFSGLYIHQGNPAESIKSIQEAHELFREIKGFYVKCEENKKTHETKLIELSKKVVSD